METYHNNGLDSVFADPGREGVTGMAYDRGRFRVVTLRNIALTAPYMHGARAAASHRRREKSAACRLSVSDVCRGPNRQGYRGSDQAADAFAADLAAMPRSTALAKDKQGMEHSFSGVALRDIFKEAGVTTGRQLRGENMVKYVLVTCADNYRVVFSLAELDSSFTDRVVILADQMEGKPLPAGVGPFRIIVPGEKKPARNCFQVTGIAVKFAKD